MSNFIDWSTNHTNYGIRIDQRDRVKQTQKDFGM